MNAQKQSAAYAAATQPRSGNTLVIVLSILLVIALIALGAMIWIHFSPLLFHTGTGPGQQPIKQHPHW
jgi:flagellar basal body-associated protein FliL